MIREAGTLCVYVSEDNDETETLFNTRDGYVPQHIQTFATGSPAEHVPDRDTFVPEHVPRVGDRVIVAMTVVRARVLASAFYEDLWPGHEDPDDFMGIYAAQKMSEPDILIVTSGWLAEYELRGSPKDVSDLGSPVELEGDGKRLAPLQPRSLYYDRKGRPIEEYEYLMLRISDTYYRVALTKVGKYTVSTVWLALDHSYGCGPPLIFETMVSDAAGKYEGYQRRYTSEADALEGHEEAVREFSIRP